MAAGRKTRKLTKGGRKKGKRGAKRSNLPVILAIVLPLALVGGYMLYHSNAGFASLIDKGVSKVGQLFSGLASESDQMVEQAPAGKQPPHGQDAKRTVSARRPELPQLPDSIAVPDAGKERKPAEIPRQQIKTASSAVVPVTVKQAQAVARLLFGGKIAGSNASPRSFWYSFRMQGGKKRYPYDARPVKVYISTVALQGTFVQGQTNSVVFVKVEDPDGTQWTSTYVGASLLAGRVGKPGRVLGSTALQAPRGGVTRHEAVDVQGDGVLELVMEIESEGPGGYLFRDLGLHGFTADGTQVLWNSRTLEDGPGVPLDVAEFKNVEFRDTDANGLLDIRVEAGRRTYTISDDFSRKFKGEKVMATTVYRQSKGRFKLALK